MDWNEYEETIITKALEEIENYSDANKIELLFHTAISLRIDGEMVELDDGDEYQDYFYSYHNLDIAKITEKNKELLTYDYELGTFPQEYIDYFEDAIDEVDEEFLKANYEWVVEGIDGVELLENAIAYRFANILRNKIGCRVTPLRFEDYELEGQDKPYPNLITFVEKYAGSSCNSFVNFLGFLDN